MIRTMTKSLLVIIASLFMPMLSYSQVGTYNNDTLINYIDINMKKQGKWVKKYDDGQVRYKGFFINDEPVGTFIYYHTNGKIKSILDYTYPDAVKAELYYPDATIAAAGKYNKSRERIGLWKMYYESGDLFAEINYKANVKHGTSTTYYPSGVILMECTFVDGLLQGSYVKYFDTGKPYEIGSYKNNQRHGECSVYDLTNQLTEKGPYFEGMRHGVWYFFAEGNIVDTVTFTYDMPDNFDEISKETQEKIEWARQNQDKFKQPEDYFDRPEDFFKP